MVNPWSGANEATVSDADARTVLAPGSGLAKTAADTTEGTLDLTAFAVCYVELHCEGQAFYFAMLADDDTELVLTDALTEVPGIPSTLDIGEKVTFVVSEARPILRFRTVSGSGGTLRVQRASK